MIARLAAAIFLLLVPAMVPAQAKVIGILFDTSGSMEDIDQLPAFGMQVLAGSLDGRAGFDRLIAMNFNEYIRRVIPEPALAVPNPATIAEVRRRLGPQVARTVTITDQTGHQAAVDALRRDFRPVRDMGTPYGPIEVMLDAIVAETKPGEAASFIIVSDGEYGDPNLPGVSDLREHFEAYRGRLKGTLRVEFLTIEPQDAARASELRAKIALQGVRDTLVEVFNGGIRRSDGSLDGVWIVSGREALWAALQDIVASVSGTDRRGQRDYVRFAGTEATLTTPLSISRVVVVSAAPEGQRPPQWTKSTFDRAPTQQRTISARMDDEDRGLDARPLTGLVQHFWFQNTVSPGTYQIGFDRAVGDEVFLLFETRAIVDLRILDEGGSEVAADSGGRRKLLVGRPYTFVSRVLDGATGTPVPVPFAGLSPNLAFALQIAGSGPAQVTSMQTDLATSLATLVWTPGVRGTFTAASRATIPGFISPASPPVAIEVLEAIATLSASKPVAAEPCATCGPTELRSQVVPNGPDVPVATFEVTATADFNGAIRFAAGAMPDFVEIRDAQGGLVMLETPLPFAAGETRAFTIWRRGALSGEAIAGGRIDPGLSVAPADPWTGAAVPIPAVIVLVAPDLGLKLVAVTAAPPSGPLDGLVVPGGELRRGAFAAQFAFENLVEPPAPDRIGTDLEVSADGWSGWLLSFAAAYSDPAATGLHALELRPRTGYWCLCYIAIENAVAGSERREVTISFRDRLGLQTARTALTLFVPVPGELFLISCLINLGLLLLFVMVLRGLVALVVTNHFPGDAVYEITEGSTMPRFRKLHRPNYTWVRAWLALFLGNPHEVRLPEGLHLTAVPGGAELDLGRKPPPWTLERMGESFESMRESNPRLETLRLIWGDRLESLTRPNFSLRLKRRAADE